MSTGREDADDPVVEIILLAGPRWPTLDPFLFCVHHHDEYPAANPDLGPDVSLAGRELGMDFSGLDGWSMYHGTTVPGFPQHPHRGFETITFARRGYIDHSDSMGAQARFGSGDVQWMTAGGGVVHAEMFPLLDADAPNPVELFQIWLNLPAGNKLVDPHFTMLWSGDIPKLTETDDEGRTIELTVIAGDLDGSSPSSSPPSPPPDSWASPRQNEVGIWHLVLQPGAVWDLPPARTDGINRTLYVFGGDVLHVGGHDVIAGNAAVVRTDDPVRMSSGEAGAEVLMLQGRPIDEPVVQHGPFVMNDRAGIEQAMRDYRSGQFGGWPWPTDDPHHGRERGRFALHADGRREEPDPG